MTAQDTTQTDQRAPQLPARFPTLRPLYSSEIGVITARARALRSGSIAIGREVSEEAGIGFPSDSRASRIHARIELDPSGQSPHIYDADSKNGTFVNGRRVMECALVDGDIIRLGNSFLLLRFEPMRAVDGRVDSLAGISPVIRAVRSEICRIGPTKSAVLLLGESGSGKDVAAQALHRKSNRSGRFIAVNCSAIPEALAESQLFGHAARAFTGAQNAQEGYFQAARGGTLFLDEIGEMPLALQPKLLRALEEGTVTPVGATEAKPCDVRILAATNRDLPRAIQAGSFRGDLYARLAELIIELPPLRARCEDILLLLLRQMASPTPRLATELVEALLLYRWPYNVRELFKIATVLRMHVAESDELSLSLVATRLSSDATHPSPTTVRTDEAAGTPRTKAFPGTVPARTSVESPPAKEELIRLLRLHKGRVLHVAEAVGRSRRQVDRWMESYELDRKDYLK